MGLACGHNERELCFAGLVGIVDPLRQGVIESIEIVRSAGVNVKMITGDAMETACSIGKLLAVSCTELLRLVIYTCTFNIN